MPINCPSCKRANDPWRHFCGGCGSGLPGGCGSCGAVNAAHDRFCGGCAKALRAIPSVVKKPVVQQTVPIEIGQILDETNA